jgi:uncharacterized protein (TIGR00251 family)
MSRREFRLHNGKKGAALTIRVTPRANCNEIVEVLSDGTLKVRLTAPPVEGQANAALIAFLSEVLGIPKSRFEIIAGEKGRDKLISILDADADTVHKQILKHLS